MNDSFDQLKKARVIAVGIPQAGNGGSFVLAAAALSLRISGISIIDRHPSIIPDSTLFGKHIWQIILLSWTEKKA